ncbi:type II secretion system protein GspL [Sphingobium sp. H39-3-25]|uniref:type II secretion system protein GspL n=1 Tax=Sphingobium arseniciresistens TaxID=3030834 RepID=UPI0023B9AF89|nr:type II secretion system protein GspL [Sphingobium arseniciresistens]
MSVREGLIVTLPATDADAPTWLRIVDGEVTQTGAGTGWLSASGVAELPASCMVMLIAPVGLTALHWIAYPDMPVRQGRAAARLTALSESIGPADMLVAAADENEDPAQPHIVAIAARADLQHWLLWAQHHGLDPDAIVPAALLLPAPAEGCVRAMIGAEDVLRGAAVAAPASDPLAAAIIGQDVPVALGADTVRWAMLDGLEAPPLNLRQGDFAKRVRRQVDGQRLRRMAVWCGFIAFISLSMSLIAIVKLNADTRRLDAQAVEAARTVLPAATDAALVLQDLDARLAERGAGAWGFTGPASGLFSAMQGAPGVSMTSLGRTADGTLRATIAAARAEEINGVLLAIQAAGFTITATSSQDPGGRTLADITVRP